MAESFDLPSVDAVTVGTVGPPGQRVFYLQARAGASLVTIKVEKQQVAALVLAIQQLVADLPEEPAGGPAPDLEEPLDPAWSAGGMGLLPFDESTRRVTLVLEEFAVEGDDPDAVASARFGLTIAQLLALVSRGEEMIAGGRPNCPLCGKPMDPEGHACVKSNGHLQH